MRSLLHHNRDQDDPNLNDAADDLEETLTPEDAAVDRKREETEAFLRELEQDGWMPDGSGGLCDPNDPEVSVWPDPYSVTLFLSPKYIERVKASLPAKPN